MEDPDLAIALRYDPVGDDAPRVTARGRGTIAASLS
jgi:type III secretion system FlhB-like substrate exporter